MMEDQDFTGTRNEGCPELEIWLATATERLVPEAVARVRAEIAAHFDEAVAARVEDGFAHDAAVDLALRDLGSPHAAGRRNRREYLTVAEAGHIEQIRAMKMKRGTRPLWFSLFVIALLSPIGFLCRELPWLAAMPFLLISPLLIIQAMRYRMLAPGHEKWLQAYMLDRMGQDLMIPSAMIVSWVIEWLIRTGAAPSERHSFGLVVLAVIAGYAIGWYVRLIRPVLKLARVARQG